MPLSKSQLEHLAILARLNLSSSEVDKFSKELQEILNYMNKLKEADIQAIKTKSKGKKINFFREDKQVVFEEKDKILKSAPKILEGYFKIPPLFKEAR